METIVARCAFLDVHRDAVMACARTPDGSGGRREGVVQDQLRISEFEAIAGEQSSPRNSRPIGQLSQLLRRFVQRHRHAVPNLTGMKVAEHACGPAHVVRVAVRDAHVVEPSHAGGPVCWGHHARADVERGAGAEPP